MDDNIADVKEKLKYKNINEQSTHQIDYQVPIFSIPQRYHEWTRGPEIPEKIYKQKPYQPKDMDSMRLWRDITKVPFDLWWQPKPITRTHPDFIIKKIPPDVDLEKEEIIKTRPRRIMTPTVCMDDITDKELRDLLIKYMYTTVWKDSCSEINYKFTERETPKQTFEKHADPIQENYSIYKSLPCGLKSKGKEWETRQFVSSVNPTRHYFKNYEHKFNTPVGRDPFEKYFSNEIRNEIEDLVEKDEIRFAYDKIKPGFIGHIPTQPCVGSYRKQELILKDKLKANN